MSNDSSIFFKEDAFPHPEWAELLALYNASEKRIKDWQRTRLITHAWWFPTADESAVHLDLKELSPRLHGTFPKGYRWRIGIHAVSGTTSEWFLYAIPMIAAVRFADTIFLDDAGYGFVTCDVAGILLRAERVVPTRCKVQELANFGYTDGETMWPTVLSERKAHPPTEQTRETARQYCAEINADFYPEIGAPNSQRMHTDDQRKHAERRWFTCGFITCLISPPVGLTLGIPYLWGLSIVGIIACGYGLMRPRQSR